MTERDFARPCFSRAVRYPACGVITPRDRALKRKFQRMSPNAVTADCVDRAAPTRSVRDFPSAFAFAPKTASR